MNRIALALIFFAVVKAFDHSIIFRPKSEFSDMCYFGLAATCDWWLFRVTPLLVGGKLCRDLQALSTASIVTNALGYALYLAWTPPTTYNLAIRGIHYAIAIRFIVTGGNDVINAINNCHRDRVVRHHPIRRPSLMAQKGHK